MTVFLTGATGIVGRLAVPLLVAAGHRVTAVGRTPAKQAALRAQGATPVALNLFDRAAVERALAGHDAVVNLATKIPATTAAMMWPGAWRENDRLRREASAVIADAARVAGVPRLVQESFAPMLADGGDAWLDAASPVLPARYNRTSLDAEQAALGFTGDGRAGVVLRFGLFYGPDSQTSRDMLRIVRLGVSPLPGYAGAFVSSLHVDDAASAVVAALSAPAGLYTVVDDAPLTRRAFADALAAAAGASPPRLLPPWTARLMGPAGALLARSVRASNRSFREATGWAPRYPSAREGWAAVARDIAAP